MPPMELTSIEVCKLVRATRLFNANQKVWLMYRAGIGDACVVGRYRGRGRYIRAWVHNGDCGPWQTIDTDREFVRRLGAIVFD